MNSIDKIPADVMMRMTLRLERIFRLNDCKPACHACWRPIEIGEKFQLATYTPPRSRLDRALERVPGSRDTMLCVDCDVPKLIQKEARINSIEAAEHRAKGGGFSRPSRSAIVAKKRR